MHLRSSKKKVSSPTSRYIMSLLNTSSPFTHITRFPLIVPCSSSISKSLPLIGITQRATRSFLLWFFLRASRWSGITMFIFDPFDTTDGQMTSTLSRSTVHDNEHVLLWPTAVAIVFQSTQFMSWNIYNAPAFDKSQICSEFDFVPFCLNLDKVSSSNKKLFITVRLKVL